MVVTAMNELPIPGSRPEYALAQMSRDRISDRCIGELEKRGSCGCAHVTRASDNTIGLNELQPGEDMASQGALYNYPIGSSRIAQLDPARNRYFKINNGPYVGDRCRDVQYSPLWESIGG